MTYPVQLNEPIIRTLKAVLEEGLPGQVETLNNEVADNYLLEPPVEILPYMPFGTSLAVGMPLVGIQDLPSEFSNDLQHSMEAEHSLGIVTVIEQADHQTLAWQLRRYNQAIMRTIQADRMLGPSGKLASEAQVMYTRFAEIIPGPLLGDRNPDAEGAPPTSFRSWTWLILECRRQEILT